MTVVRNSLAALTFLCLLTPYAKAQEAEQVRIDAGAATTPFPHFWEQTFGSGRAILSLRESYRNDLRAVKQATGFQSVRFHGIFNDEVGLYDPDRVTKNPGLAAEKAGDESPYNFAYVDQIYDGLLENHVKPYVEMSFMPAKLAADPKLTQSFWYKPIVSPPKDYGQWDAMIRAFAAHLIGRYGLAEVATWKFEVWNEPNLDFWGGDPRQASYWELYDHTALALKAVSPKLQVGGPATSATSWVTDFLVHVKAAKVPADFVSTHVYANDDADDVFHTTENVSRKFMVWRAVKKVHEEILASPFPHMPLILSEYGASYANEPNVTDTTYMGPWLANTIRLCDGLTEAMAYWDFSDVFEEQGVVRSPFYGGFGLMAADSIPKPLFNAFAVLHRLGERRIKVASDALLATKGADGSVVIAAWNYAPPTGTGATYVQGAVPSSAGKEFDLQFLQVPASAGVEIYRVDEQHGNVLAAFNAMGRPSGSLSRDQISQLREASAMKSPETTKLVGGKLQLTVPVYGLAIVVVHTR